MTANGDGRGSAENAEVHVIESFADSDAAQRDNERLHVYLSLCEDAVEEVAAAKRKVEKAEKDLEDARASVADAEDKLAALDGRK